MRASDFLKTSEGKKYLLCDGSEVPAEYSKLRSLMTYTPDLRDRVPQGAGIYAINTSIEAALPNITGFGMWECIGYNYLGMYVGALKQGSGYGSTYATSTGGISGYSSGLAFDASLSNSIYKDECSTVQPPALAVNFYIKAK